MSKTPKYRSKHVFWDAINQVTISPDVAQELIKKNRNKRPENIWRFDSQHEFRVYLALIEIYGADRIIRQHKIVILPPSRCYPKGKNWRVDFAVTSKTPLGGYSFFVEAKGAFLPEFGSTLANLEQYDSMTFDRTYIIFDQKIPSDNKVVKALLNSDFKHHLLTLRTLKNRSSYDDSYRRFTVPD
ncbi:MAG: hypothetical protein AAFQ80_05470 [Cyanobacteria bacterium J06621_8]